MRLSADHWNALDWLHLDGFITTERLIAMSWHAWNLDRALNLDTTFQTALGFGIQEANVQYESWKNGFTNDNT